MAHAQISVEPFDGSDNEDFAQFEQLFQGYVGVAGIANAQQANFLQWHLRDSALRFYQTLPALTKADVPHCLAALRDHFCNPQLQEVHVLKLEQSKSDIKRDSPENFLVNLTKKAQRAYPTPDLPAVSPLDAALVGAAAEADAARFHGETAQRQERLDAENDHRNNQIKRLFIKGMPNWLRSKMMEQPAATTVQELCNLARKQMTIRDSCRNEDYPEDSFKEIGDTVSHNLISALSKLTTAQEQIEKQLNEVRSELSDQRKMIQSRPQDGKPNNNKIKEAMHRAKELEMTQLREIRLALTKGMEMGNKDTIEEEVDLVKKKRTDGREMMGDTETQVSLGFKIYSTPHKCSSSPNRSLECNRTPIFNKTRTIPKHNRTPRFIRTRYTLRVNKSRATSDSYATTTERPVCPTSCTTNDAAGAHSKSQYSSSSHWSKVL